ncbi:hypothetical protein IscW_ISCW000986, partial [Ixodes scapularis]
WTIGRNSGTSPFWSKLLRMALFCLPECGGNNAVLHRRTWRMLHKGLDDDNAKGPRCGGGGTGIAGHCRPEGAADRRLPGAVRGAERRSLLLVALARYVALLTAGVAGLAVFGTLAGDVAHLAAVVARHPALAEARSPGAAAVAHPRAATHAAAAAGASSGSAATEAAAAASAAGAVRAAVRAAAAIAAAVPAAVAAALVSLRAFAGEMARLVARVALLGTHGRRRRKQTARNGSAGLKRLDTSTGYAARNGTKKGFAHGFRLTWCSAHGTQLARPIPPRLARRSPLELAWRQWSDCLYTAPSRQPRLATLPNTTNTVPAVLPFYYLPRPRVFAGVHR